MDVNRILRLADALYGEDTRRQIFEPLVADLQRELAAHPRLWLRWRLAVAGAFIQCAPRAFTVGTPRALWFEVAVRVACVGALAFALLQYLNGRPEAGTRSSPALAAAALSFVIIPAVWRIRLSELPPRKQRMMVTWFVALIATVQAVMGEGGWAARLALAAGAPLLALIGWKLRDRERDRTSPLAAHPLVRWVQVAVWLTFATWPAKLALGIRFFDPRWNGDQFVIYLLAGLVIITSGRERRNPGPSPLHPPGTRTT
jgi:hypothetical protein